MSQQQQQQYLDTQGIYRQGGTWGGLSVGVGQSSLRRLVAVSMGAALSTETPSCLALPPCELESSECQGGRGEGTGVGHLLAYQCRSALVYVPLVRRLMRDVKTACYCGMPVD